MKLHYDRQTDSLYISLRPAAGVDVRVLSEDVVADVDAAGGVVGLDIQHASRNVDLGTLDSDLPTRPGRRSA